MNYDIIDTLNKFLGSGENNNIYLSICIYIFATSFDFILGLIKASFSEKEDFRSFKLKDGLIKKAGIVILLFLLLVLSLLIPEGLFFYYTALLGFIIAEIYSISAHLGLTEDDKTDSNFYKKIFKNFLSKLIEFTDSRDDNNDKQGGI